MKTKKGFTIIELGVVVLLIGGISLGLTPFVKNIRQRSRQVRCVHNLQSISLALRIYVNENDEILPSDLGVLFTKGYVEKEDIFDCPFTAHRGKAEEPDYIYNDRFDFKAQENIPIVYDKEGHYPGVSKNVLYLNGEIKEKARWPSS